MKMETKLGGFEQLDNLLSRLPQNVENKVLQKSVTKAFRIALRAVKANAPRDEDGQSPASKKYGRLFQNIKIRASKRDRKKGQRGAFISTGRSFWGLLLEKGTRYISAKPWFLPAITSTQQEVFKDLAANIAEGIETEALKLAKK